MPGGVPAPGGVPMPGGAPAPGGVPVPSGSGGDGGTGGQDPKAGLYVLNSHQSLKSVKTSVCSQLSIHLPNISHILLHCDSWLFLI